MSKPANSRGISFINMKYLPYLWFLVLLQSSDGEPRKTDTINLGSLNRRPGKSMRRVVAGTSSESSKSFNYQVNKYAIASKIVVHQYCKDTNSPVEAEILFKLGMESRSSTVDKWWKNVPRGQYNVLPQATSNPVCSQTPNGKMKSARAISQHGYFQSRIFIPVARGEKKIFATEYEILKPRTVLTSMLKCECAITMKGGRSEICEQGSIYLSKGVGGDSSFFVHTRNLSSGTFKVVAHLCFK